MRRPIILVVLAATLLAACGGDGVDRSDPRSVVRAYYAAEFRCGEDGAGVQYDLSIYPSRDWTREDHLRHQRRSGCQPQAIPPAEVARLDQHDDIAIVQLSTHDGDRVFRLRRGADGWRVDLTRSDAIAAS